MTTPAPGAGEPDPGWRPPLDLGGPWRAHPAVGDLAKEFGDPALADASWAEVTVPGHWRSHPTFATADGPVLYRRRFGLDAPPPGGRAFLELDGVFSFGDVWFDGDYLGATEGPFVPHAFEITEAVRARDDHLVAVEVGCPRPEGRPARRLLTGIFGAGPDVDPGWNPGGLWRAVRVRPTGPARIGRLRLLCTEATEGRGHLALDLSVDAGDRPEAGPLPGRLAIRARAADGTVLAVATRDVTLAAGDNHLAHTIRVDDPPRWWPRGLGDQALVEVETVIEVAGAPSDRVTRRTAIRDVRLDDWTLRVNGERLFVRGARYGPTRMALAEASAAEVRRDVDLALETNLGLLRVHAHVGQPALYDAADEAGLLLWQDLPLHGAHARSVRRPAIRQARALVDLLGHHPSIALWCAHDEPFRRPEAPDRPHPGGASRRREAAAMFLPTWSKDVLDRSIRRALRRADPSRSVVRYSGVLPGPASAGTDPHLGHGWRRGELHGLAPALRSLPRLARFVGGIGAASVPPHADFCEPDRWPDLDWERLERRHGLDRARFDRYVPPAQAATFGAWQAATQDYHAAVIQVQIEDLRRLKYHPTGGFVLDGFADARPLVSTALLDHERAPKAAHRAARDACRDVLPMIDPRTGSVHVVNDRRDRLAGVRVTVRAGAQTRSFVGDVDADGIAFVGRVALAGVRAAEVTLEHPATGRVTNRYAGRALLGAGDDGSRSREGRG